MTPRGGPTFDQFTRRLARITRHDRAFSRQTVNDLLTKSEMFREWAPRRL